VQGAAPLARPPRPHHHKRPTRRSAARPPRAGCGRHGVRGAGRSWQRHSARRANSGVPQASEERPPKRAPCRSSAPGRRFADKGAAPGCAAPGSVDPAVDRSRGAEAGHKGPWGRFVPAEGRGVSPRHEPLGRRSGQRGPALPTGGRRRQESRPDRCAGGHAAKQGKGEKGFHWLGGVVALVELQTDRPSHANGRDRASASPLADALGSGASAPCSALGEEPLHLVHDGVHAADHRLVRRGRVHVQAGTLQGGHRSLAAPGAQDVQVGLAWCGVAG